MELRILREGSLRPCESTNPACPWSKGCQEMDYYMHVELPMRQVHGARDIRKGIIITC